MSSSHNPETIDLPLLKDEDDARFELLFKRNVYLEKEYAKAMRQLSDEKEAASTRNKDLQLLSECRAKMISLQNKYTKTAERINNYHSQMQQAQAGTIGLKRKINGVIGHIKAALRLDLIPGASKKEVRNAYEKLYEENKLLKWKLNVVEGYLSGMFSDAEDEENAG